MIKPAQMDRIKLLARSSVVGGDIKALLEAFVTSQAALRVALHYINTERNKANVYSIEFVNESIRMALGSQYDAEGKPSPQRGADLIEGKS
jgi:hypothetical protein